MICQLEKGEIMKDFSNNFISKIKSYIDSHETTSTALAKKLGMSQSSLSMYMCGYRTPSVAVCLLIEKELNLPAGYLIYDKIKPLTSTRRLPLLNKKDVDAFIKKGIIPHDVIFLPVYFDSTKGHAMSEKSFFITAEGDAMLSKTKPEQSIFNLDKAAVDPYLQPVHGSKVLIEVNGDLKIREMMTDGNDVFFKAFDESIPVIKSKDAKVVGRVFLKQTTID